MNSKGSAYLATSFIKFVGPSANKARRPQRFYAPLRQLGQLIMQLASDQYELQYTRNHCRNGCHDTIRGEFGSTMRSVANLEGFKIASLNSLLKHIDEIRHVFRSTPFDISAINESKIDESILDNEISIPGYNLIRKDRNRAGGGVVLYIRNNIPFSDRKDLVPSSLEMVCAEINRPHSKSFLACTWYRPPNSDMDIFNECKIFFQRCDADSRELILVGDLNCDVSKVSLDPHTRQLIFLCSLYQIDQLIDKPTRVTDTSATMIDLV